MEIRTPGFQNSVANKIFLIGFVLELISLAYLTLKGWSDHISFIEGSFVIYNYPGLLLCRVLNVPSGESYGLSGTFSTWEMLTCLIVNTAILLFTCSLISKFNSVGHQRAAEKVDSTPESP